MNLIFRRCEKRDRKDIAEILYLTGFMGEDLTYEGRFRDKKLFALINTDGYVLWETSNGFVAEDTESRKVVGYIIGTDDTISYERLFFYRMYWRILVRLFSVSWWRYPESFRMVFYWFLKYETKSIEHLYETYPSHLHINIIKEYQRHKIGEKLIRLFIENMKNKGVTGIHLGTSNYNIKALPFYRKNGFNVVFERENPFWPGVADQFSVIFARKL